MDDCLEQKKMENRIDELVAEEVSLRHKIKDMMAKVDAITNQNFNLEYLIHKLKQQVKGKDVNIDNICKSRGGTLDGHLNAKAGGSKEDAMKVVYYTVYRWG